MPIGGQAPTGSFAISPNDEASRALIYDVAGCEVPRHRVGASLARSNCDPTVIAPIRHKLRAIASESGPGKALNAVKLLRPLVAQGHNILRERFEAGGSAQDYLRDRAKLADSAVVGLLHVASISNGIRNRSMVAPLAAIAVGGYGRKQLAPGSDLDLLFLLPESSRACPGGVPPATMACISAVVASLWDLGFELDHAARSASECLELARDNATVLAGLVDRRFLWGGFGLFTSLDTDITVLLSGPDAARWRDAIGDALSSTHRHASHEMQALEDEPDLKRGPGGLRDLQRAIWVNTCASGRLTSLIQAPLIEAHRFLWLVRCHLHFLAGRAEDRLSLSLQPGVARRLGLDAPHKSAAPLLLDLFRYHASNVLAAIGVTPRSPRSARMVTHSSRSVHVDGCLRTGVSSR
jgi:[protein-PII] uridylyltransferase